MKTKTKALLISVCAVLLIAALGFTTLAYLTDTENNVKNTFTVGNVQIDLKESKVNTSGQRVADNGTDILEESAESVYVTAGNVYNLVPGHTYRKDPTVFVSAKSEKCYVRVFATLTQVDQWDNALKNGDTTANLFTETDTNPDTGNWTLVNDTPGIVTSSDGIQTRTYEFRYKTTASAGDKITPFKSIKVPSYMDNDDLKNIDGGTAIGTAGNKAFMYLYAQAIQADGLSAEQAFGATGLATPTLSDLTGTELTTTP